MEPMSKIIKTKIVRSSVGKVSSGVAWRFRRYEVHC